jgi:hypothetical protein
MDNAALLIPIFGIVLGVGGPVLAIILATYYSHRTKVAKYEALKSAISGNLPAEQMERIIQSLSPDETGGSVPERPRRKNITTGITLVSLALALILAALVVGHIEGFAVAALVIGFIGIAKLLVAFLVQKDDGGDKR